MTCFEEARYIGTTCEMNDTMYATYNCVSAAGTPLQDWQDFFNTTSECEAVGGVVTPNSTCLEHSNLLTQRPRGRVEILQNSVSMCTYRDILRSRCCSNDVSASTTAAPVSTTTEEQCPTCVCNENPCYNANQSFVRFGNSSNCSST